MYALTTPLKIQIGVTVFVKYQILSEDLVCNEDEFYKTDKVTGCNFINFMIFISLLQRKLKVALKFFAGDEIDMVQSIAFSNIQPVTSYVHKLNSWIYLAGKLCSRHKSELLSKILTFSNLAIIYFCVLSISMQTVQSLGECYD